MNETDIRAEETVGVINARLGVAKDYTKPWKDKIMHRRDLYDGRHYKSEAKANEQRYPDPTPTNTVDLAVGIIMSNDMEWAATPWEPDPVEDNEASNIEKYLQGLIHINSEREQTHIPYAVAMHFCRDGCAVLYSTWSPKRNRMGKKEKSVTVIDSEAKEGVRKFDSYVEPPLEMKVIDPIEISVLPGGEHRWQYLFRETTMTAYEVETKFNVKLKKFDGMTEEMKMHTKETLIDYWRYAEMADGPTDRVVVINAVLFANEFLPGFEPRVMVGYEDIPYLYGFFKPIDPNSPVNWGHSILDPQESSVQMLEEAVNKRLRSINTFASLPMVIKTRPGRQLEVDPGFDSPVVLDTEEDIGFPTWPGSPPDVDKHIELLRSRIQQSGFADVMFGAGPGAVTGYAMSQLGDQNRIRMEQPIGHLEMFWSIWARRALRMTAAFANKSFIRVYGMRDNKQFSENVFGGDAEKFHVSCHIVADFPNDQVRKSAMATQAGQYLSKKTIMEKYYNIHQPDDEREQQLIEQAEEHPIMKMYGIIRALQKYTKSEDPDIAQAAEMAMQALQAQLQPQESQQPKMGSEPTNLLGTQSADGQATPQAMGRPAPGQDEAAAMEAMTSASPGMMGEITGGIA